MTAPSNPPRVTETRTFDPENLLGVGAILGTCAYLVLTGPDGAKHTVLTGDQITIDPDARSVTITPARADR